MAGREEAAARVIREDFLEAVTRMQVAQGEPLRQRVCHCPASPPDASSRAQCVPLVVSPRHVPASPLPHLCAGGPSMMMLIHRICMALRGLGRLHTVDSVMRLKRLWLLPLILPDMQKPTDSLMCAETSLVTASFNLLQLLCIHIPGGNRLYCNFRLQQR